MERSALDESSKFRNGLMINICWVALLAPSNGSACAASFSSVLMSALGFLVKRTDVASARNSRWRETAQRTKVAAMGAIIENRITIAIKTRIAASPPEPPLPLRPLELPEPL